MQYLSTGKWEVKLEFKPATKDMSYLRLAIYGPSGSGKTYSSLAIATGMGGKIAVIDTERGSASLYADQFKFDVLEPEDYRIQTYLEAIKMAEDAGYEILIIDSLSHAWFQLLETVDVIAKSKYKGNSWAAWSDATPAHRSLFDTILRYPGHVIATMRSKTEWTTQGPTGKTRPVRVGLAPEQRKGTEYEFTMLMELTPEHTCEVTKDRTGKFQDRLIEKPGPEIGEELMEWLKGE